MHLKMARRHLVLLPGLDGTGSLFAPLLANLPETLMPVVVKYPPDQVLYYEQLFPYIREVMPWDQPFILLAESFSGPMAIKFAAEQPANIHALVLVSSFFSKVEAPNASWTSFFTKEKWFERATPDSAIKQLVTGGIAEPALLAAIKEAIHTVRPEVLAHRVRLMFEFDYSRALQEMRAPLLCLAGKQDKLAAPQAIQKLLEGRENSSCVNLDASHLLLQTHPKEALKAIQEFVHKLPVTDIPVTDSAAAA
jgi:pimeloyl-[acyl-carrier protein] methyl ester esterase